MMLKISVRRDRCDHGWDHLGSIHAALANLDHMPISDLQKIRPESPDAAVELALIHLRVMMWKPWQLQNCRVNCTNSAQKSVMPEENQPTRLRCRQRAYASMTCNCGK